MKNIRAIKVPVDSGHKLNVHKTFRRRSGRLLNVLCTFSLRLVSTGVYKPFKNFVNGLKDFGGNYFKIKGIIFFYSKEKICTKPCV